MKMSIMHCFCVIIKQCLLKSSIIGVLYKLIKLNVAVLIKTKCYFDGAVQSVTQFRII